MGGPRSSMLALPKWSRSLGPLVATDLRRRYAGSVLGDAWSVFSPLIEVGAYTLVFAWILGAVWGTAMPYPVFIASGLFPWIAFREAIEGSASVLPDNRWIRRSRVPLELLVARVGLAASVRAIVGLLVVFAFAGFAGPTTTLASWTWPFLALALQLVTSFGLGLLVAPLSTLFPDLRPTLVSALTLLTFVSPILYPESIAHGAVRALVLCNPFTHFLRLYRSPVNPLALEDAVLSVTVALASALASLAAGHAARHRLWWSARDLL
jgi:ABC-type polysaccharide/polyol phosphate export permease